MCCGRQRVNRIARAAAVLGVHQPRNVRQKLAKIAATLIALTGLGLNVGIANAATLSSASVALSDPRPTQGSVTYTFTGSGVSNAAIRCVEAIFATTATGQVNPTNWDGTGGSITTGSST